MVRAMLLPPGGLAQAPSLLQLLDLLDRYCLAPDGSLVVKSTYQDLLLAREEMGKERLRYFEAVALHCEAVAMVEEYHQAISVANAGGMRDLQAVLSQLGFRSNALVYDALAHRLTIAEAAQRLRLPLIAKDGELPDDDLEKWSLISRSSFDSSSTTSFSTNTTVTSVMSSSVGTGPGTINLLLCGSNPSEMMDPGIGGAVDRMLGLTPAWLCQTQLANAPFAEDSTVYQMAFTPEIEGRLQLKCEKLTSVFEADEAEITSLQRSTRLSERVKLAVEAIVAEESALMEDLFSADRKFSEYHNVLEQILAVLVRLVKDFKITRQFQYVCRDFQSAIGLDMPIVHTMTSVTDGMRKSWLCKRCQTMNTKLRVLEHLLLRDTYTQDSIPALYKIREHLVEANEEATGAYNRAAIKDLIGSGSSCRYKGAEVSTLQQVTRLREYQGVDKYFDDIAHRYHELATKLEGIQWTIRQVEMDLNTPQEEI